MKKKSLVFPILLLWSSALLVIVLFFGKIMLNPYDYLMENNDDGLKNYYTFAHYIKHDKGLHFSGLNYPYGEHIVYTDNHPIWAYTFNLIDDYIFPIADHSVAMLNFWMFFSISLGAIFLYLILLKFGVGRWFAIFPALFITFLSPQIDRTFAHFSLSYIYFIPMYWYFFIRFNEGKKRWLWGGLLFLSLTIFGFTQMYHVLIGAVFFLAYIFVYTVSNIRSSQPLRFTSSTSAPYFKYIGSVLLCGVLPVLLIQIFMGFTDPYTDRIEVPYGFYAYKAFFEQTFFPVYPPFRQVFIYLFKAYETTWGETTVSVGLTGFVLFVLLLGRTLHFIIRKQFHRVFRFVAHYELNLYLWASIIVLAFSFAFPFILGLDWLLDYIPQLRQFRSLARFAWIFYYVFGVYGAYYWYLNYKNFSRKGKGLAISILTIVFFIWGFEAHINMWYLSGNTKKHRDVPRENTVFNSPPYYLDSLAAKGIDINAYQAAFAFPYFHIGSEKFAIKRDYRTLRRAVGLSYHTGLPLFGNYASRSSISRSLKTVQLLSSPLIQKEAANDLTDQPILILHFKPGGIEIDEQRLIQQGQLLFEDATFAIYEIDKSAFDTNFSAIHQHFKEIQDSLFIIDNTTLKSTDSTAYVFYNDYENTPSSIVLDGKGAATTTAGTLTFLDKIIPKNEKNLEATFWLYTDTRQNYPKLTYDILDPNGNILHTENREMWDKTEVYKNWIKVTVPLQTSVEARHRLTYHDPDNITVDELLIKPQGVDIYRKKSDGDLVFNGYFIPISSN